MSKIIAMLFLYSVAAVAAIDRAFNPLRRASIERRVLVAPLSMSDREVAEWKYTKQRWLFAGGTEQQWEQLLRSRMPR